MGLAQSFSSPESRRSIRPPTIYLESLTKRPGAGLGSTPSTSVLLVRIAARWPPVYCSPVSSKLAMMEADSEPPGSRTSGASAFGWVPRHRRASAWLATHDKTPGQK